MPGFTGRARVCVGNSEQSQHFREGLRQALCWAGQRLGAVGGHRCAMLGEGAGLPTSQLFSAAGQAA